jgi:microcompartment protein CcmL/EutN
MEFEYGSGIFMSNLSEDTTTALPTEAELVEMITELEQYRERLVTETEETAKRAKLMKSAVMAQLAPELAQIDAALQQLRQQQTTLTTGN